MNINRDYYLNKLIRHKHNGFIKIISGIRRCGKSYMLFELFKNHLLKQGVSDSHIIKIQLDNRKHQKYQTKSRCAFPSSLQTNQTHKGRYSKDVFSVPATTPDKKCGNGRVSVSLSATLSTNRQ